MSGTDRPAVSHAEFDPPCEGDLQARCIEVTDHSGNLFHIPAGEGFTSGEDSSSCGIAPPKPLTLAQCIYTSGGVPSPALCSGIGTCGKCRIRFVHSAPDPHEADVAYFSSSQLADGWRLGCHHTAAAGMKLELPPLAKPKRISKRITAQGPYRLAVDLGTTSLHWRLLAENAQAGGEPEIVAQGNELNPQMGAGCEVMSRMAFASDAKGKSTLRRLVVQKLQDIVMDICPEVEEICVAGNSVMTYLLLDLPLDGLASAPYRLEYRGGTVERIAGLPPVYIPPLAAPFVGADITAGVSALEGKGAEYPFMLADLGTNGEFVLALSPESAFVTSVALGPALEGIGLTFGTNAQAGAITGFSLTPAGIQARTMDGASPSGISGTGYLSLVNQLKKAGLVGIDGRFSYPPYAPLAARLARDFSESGGERRLMLPHGYYLSSGDLEELLKVKAAFSLAFTRLLEQAGLQPSTLRRIYLAGALGQHAPVSDLEGLGFIPAGLGGRVASCGNASLQGAERFLLDPAARRVSERWSSLSVAVDLTGDSDFTQNYMRHMRFIYS